MSITVSDYKLEPSYIPSPEEQKAIQRALRLSVDAQKVRLKPHQFRELVNSLTKVAINYHATEQLRAQVGEALARYIDPGHKPIGPSDLTSEQWETLYYAQCEKTDELAEKIQAKSDAALKARIKELEEQLMRVNKSLIAAQSAPIEMLAKIEAKIKEKITHYDSRMEDAAGAMRQLQKEIKEIFNGS